MIDAELGPQDALIVVDVQNDFCPGGRLPVPQGDRVIPVINRCIDVARRSGCLVVASRDWHPACHVSFESQGGTWPEHCVQDTAGAAFHPDLNLPAETVKVSKGVRLDRDQYSAFDDTGLADFLHKRGVRRVWVAGLAQDVCVLATVTSACQAGFDTSVIGEGTRPIDAADGRKAMQQMRLAGARITEGSA